MSADFWLDFFLLWLGVVCFVGMLYCLDVCCTSQRKDEE